MDAPSPPPQHHHHHHHEAVNAALYDPPTAVSTDAAATDVSVHGIGLDIDADELTATVSTTGLQLTEPTTATSATSATSTPSSAAANTMSAVYRWYDIEATLSLKRREESSIARCRLCRAEGKLERKSCVRFSKSVTSNLWRHLKENHPDVYAKHAGEKKTIQMHKLVHAKKRGRRKKEDGGGGIGDDETGGTNERFLADDDDSRTRQGDVNGNASPSDSSTTSGRKPVTKKPRRAMSGSSTSNAGDQFFQDYAALSGVNTVLPVEKRGVNMDKLRDVAAAMCLRQMVPMELCSSSAFRLLLSECLASPALMEDASTYASVFGKDVIGQQVKKMVAECNEHVTSHIRAMDGVHLIVTAWRRSRDIPAEFMAYIAVGLDRDFHPVRRCLHVLPVGSELETQIGLRRQLQKALDGTLLERCVPSVLVVEPHHRNEYGAVTAPNKLEVVESITSLLRDIMLSTITEHAFSHLFVMGGDPSAYELDLGAFAISFDSGKCMEWGVGSEHVFAQSGREVPSRILSELPNVLTGHTIRDILLKLLHMIAHVKHSSVTRHVMKSIVTEQLHWDADAFAELFENELSATTISIQSIYNVLTLTIKMMPILQRYYEHHKDGTTDFSKLVQLATLSTYEWERVGYLANLLRPFADAIMKLQAEKYVTSSLIIPTIYTLLEKLRDVPMSTPENGTLPEDMIALKNVAYAKLSSSFGYFFVSPDEDWSVHQRQTFNWLWSATLLDPRTRPFIIKGPLTQAQFWELIKAETAAVCGTNQEKANDRNGPDSSIALDDDHVAAHAQVGLAGHSSKSGDLWDDLQANLASCAQEEMLLTTSKSALEATKSNNLIEVEISFFQEEGRISLRGNPLDWWQTMLVKYPFLARVARYVLSMPCHAQVDENPVMLDAGLLRRIQSQMPLHEVCETLSASMNLRFEQQLVMINNNRSLWTTV